jgi:hypothetical protein
LEDHRWIKIEKTVYQVFNTEEISLSDKILICDFYRIYQSWQKFEKTSQILSEKIHEMDINQLSNFIYSQRNNKDFKQEYLV